MADELPINYRTPAIAEYNGTSDPMEHLSRFENAALLHRYTDGIKYRVFVTTFARAAQQCRKLRKIELSLFAVRQKDNEPLKEYLQRFNAAALEENVWWEKARGTGPYQKTEGDKAKEIRAASPKRSPKGGTRQASGSKEDNNDIPRKGVIRMITGGPLGGDSHRARKSQIREAYDMSLKKVIEVEAMEDTPLIQFERAEWSGSRTSHNDALVIIAVLANYEVWHIFIDSGSSADILFGEAYDQMQLGDISLEKVNTSLYEFVGEVIHPRGRISLPVTMGEGTTRKTCVLKFLVVDVPSAYNVILGRPTLTAFQAVISIYHMKIKFPTPGGVGEVQGDHLQSRKYYVEAVRKGQKRNRTKITKGFPSVKRERWTKITKGSPEEMETTAKVQPAKELLNIEVTPGSPDKTTRIGSHLGGRTKEEIISCLRRNADIFAWAPQDLEGIYPR
ncbi:UNVERIFIED_CONTAM: hypothetical protein Slati_2169700 [Sesamum latifolium]|uniref:Uncharacterized protein n=1 Tax=Sesamum latifolium TaxID=2727402 RepID=A0AAW2WSQ1_9LAMI